MLTRSIRIDDECKQTERDGGAKETVEGERKVEDEMQIRESGKDTEGYE